MVERHTDLRVCMNDAEIQKLERSPLCKQKIELTDQEGEEIATEVVMKKKKIKDNKPITFGLAILQWSKLLFLE